MFFEKQELKGVSFKGTPLEKYMNFFGLSGKFLVYFDLDNNPILQGHLSTSLSDQECVI